MADPVAPSYSIYVPGIASSQLPAYFRLGYPERTSGVEQAYYTGSVAKDAYKAMPFEAGILLYSPGTITQYMANSVSVRTSNEALALAVDQERIVSSTFSYEEAGSYHEVRYGIGQSTAWSFDNSVNWKVGAGTTFTIGVDQKAALAASFSVGLASSVAVSARGLKVEVDENGYNTVYGRSRVRTRAKERTVAGESLTFVVSKTVNPELSIAARLADMIARVTAITATASGLASVAVPSALLGEEQLGAAFRDGIGKTGRTITAEAEAWVKRWSKGIAYAGYGVESLVAVSHAAYLLAGLIAFKTSGAMFASSPYIAMMDDSLVDNQLLPKQIIISVGQSSIVLTSDRISLETPSLEIFNSQRTLVNSKEIEFQASESAILYVDSDPMHSVAIDSSACLVGTGESYLNLAPDKLALSGGGFMLQFQDGSAKLTGTDFAVNAQDSADILVGGLSKFE